MTGSFRRGNKSGARTGRRLLRDPGAVLGGVLLLAVVGLAALAPVVSPYDPLRHVSEAALEPPGLTHPFGTDQFGRDVLSRTLHAARLSLPIGVASVALAALPGVALGLLAGYYTGWVRATIMRLADVLLSFPHLLLALAVAAMLGRDPRNVALAVAVAFVPQYIRVVQAATLAAAGLGYVDAARALGASEGRIIVRHLLPSVAAPILVLATLGMALAILTAAALSFLGLGAPPPTPEWGLMLTEARDYLRDAWWMGTFPGLAITLTVLGVNLVGDALRDALDPRLAA